MERRLEIWKQYEKLLISAIKKSHYHGLVKLLQFETNSMDCMKEFKETCTAPLITAIEQKNLVAVNLLKEYDYKLPLPHHHHCGCPKCKQDKFGKVREEVTVLKALCHPIWIIITSEDPFSTIFRYSGLDEGFSKNNYHVSFQKEYERISQDINQFAVALLDGIESESEGATLMKYKRTDDDLSFIDIALDHDQKDVVAHPVIQYHLQSKIFGDIPGWENRGILYKVLLETLIAVLYPITSLLSIFVPSSCASVANVTTKPFVKLISGAGSFLTFLAFLIYMGASDRKESSIRTSKTPTGVEFAVLIWTIGFCFAEYQQICSSGLKRYFANGWNWVDVIMDFLMIFTFVIWIVLWGLRNTKPPIDRSSYETMMYIADGTFAVAIVLCFFRLLYLCQVTRNLGLLQICLGEMIMVIFQFMFIEIIVLLAFTVAMGYLHSSSKQARGHKNVYQDKYKNDTAIYATFAESFNGFFSTFFTMVYVSLGVEGTSTLTSFEDGTLVHLWANIFFISYIGVSMIVMLNILIAMMNTSYNIIADNIEREHLFSQTKLWMEYTGDRSARPVPFNLIPSVQGIIDLFRRISSARSARAQRGVGVLEKNEESSYKNVCEALVKRYMEKEFGIPGRNEIPKIKDISTTKDMSAEDDDFLQIIENSMNSWQEVLTGVKYAVSAHDNIAGNPGTILVAASNE